MRVQNDRLLKGCNHLALMATWGAAETANGMLWTLFMVLFASDDGERPVELFQQQDAAHFMGQG